MESIVFLPFVKGEIHLFIDLGIINLSLSFDFTIYIFGTQLPA